MEALDEKTFMKKMEKSENISGYSEYAMRRFWDWMFKDESGIVQTCVFPIPPEGKDQSDMGNGQWKHVMNFTEFKNFCSSYSDVWQYQVYAGINTLDTIPDSGRGSIDHIDRVNNISLDIETERESYKGATKEEVWWCYGLALSEAKFLWDRYRVYPMVVMSENGIHLHYKADLEVTDEFLIGKQHVISKYLTYVALESPYIDKLEEFKPDSVNFDQDDVSDVPRVMKVPGTRGIKSEPGRMCGIIHCPSKEDAGVITEDTVDVIMEEMEDMFGGREEEEEKLSISVADSSPLDGETETRVKSLAKNDPSFRKYWTGEIEDYKSRSEAEFAFVLKLLNHGFSVDEIVSIMFASGMSKWDEESNNYRRRTIKKAKSEFDGNVTKDSTNGSYSFSRV